MEEPKQPNELKKRGEKRWRSTSLIRALCTLSVAPPLGASTRCLHQVIKVLQRSVPLIGSDTLSSFST